MLPLTLIFVLNHSQNVVSLLGTIKDFASEAHVFTGLHYTLQSYLLYTRYVTRRSREISGPSHEARLKRHFP